MLWALDVVANIAPIHDCRRFSPQAGGQGLQVMVGGPFAALVEDLEGDLRGPRW